MATSPQKRAMKKYRSRLAVRGMARFEVLGRKADRELIRSVAKRLAEEGPEAARLRAAVSGGLDAEPRRTGGILEPLRRSPMVGESVIRERPVTPRRKIDL